MKTSPKPADGVQNGSKRRAADLAYDAIEVLFSTLQLEPGSPVVETELVQRTGLGRTPVREALLRLASSGLIVQQPRRGLLVSHIDLGEYLDVILTRRALESLIASCSARRASTDQRKEIVRCAERMVKAAARGSLDDYMRADHELDVVNHQASENRSAVNCVVPLIVLCRRFWYAYQHEGEMGEGARAHLQLAEGIASADEAAAVLGADALMDYLERFARRVIER
jgi:DNA-binding GntR family transcriptional regulator